MPGRAASRAATPASVTCVPATFSDFRDLTPSSFLRPLSVSATWPRLSADSGRPARFAISGSVTAVLSYQSVFNCVNLGKIGTCVVGDRGPHRVQRVELGGIRQCRNRGVSDLRVVGGHENQFRQLVQGDAAGITHLRAGQCQTLHFAARQWTRSSSVIPWRTFCDRLGLWILSKLSRVIGYPPCFTPISLRNMIASFVGSERLAYEENKIIKHAEKNIVFHGKFIFIINLPYCTNVELTEDYYMKMVSYAAFVLFVVGAMPASALEGDEIGSALDAALAEGLSTADQVAAIERAAAEWDALLNRRYRALEAGLPADSGAVLKQSQRAWIHFRDAEFHTLAGIYRQKDGSMFIPMQAIDRMEIVKQRVLELESYLDLLSLGEE